MSLELSPVQIFSPSGSRDSIVATGRSGEFRPAARAGSDLQGLDLKDLVLLSGTSHLTFSTAWHVLPVLSHGSSSNQAGFSRCSYYRHCSLSIIFEPVCTISLGLEIKIQLWMASTLREFEGKKNARIISDNTTMVEMDPGSRKDI
ncbi:hypothetical protein OIU85_007168 [Salix viminalis]|uniref:Uncharacterized protein n=1 Tax=Salix viminalis TaxID=40686 RepID=A0A9Q0P896_SALVM|nr:hypothetical protein OIU85_007168 [Salix viminalis]